MWIIACMRRDIGEYIAKSFNTIYAAFRIKWDESESQLKCKSKESLPWSNIARKFANLIYMGKIIKNHEQQFYPWIVKEMVECSTSVEVHDISVIICTWEIYATVNLVVICLYDGLWIISAQIIIKTDGYISLQIKCEAGKRTYLWSSHLRKYIFC